MDVGAGSGAFALSLAKTGVFDNVLAIDLSDECVEACRRLGLTAERRGVDELAEESVDLLTMNDLIEHVFSPRDFLDICLRALRPGGVLSLATPNNQGFDFQILKENTENITPPEHLNYFNPESCRCLLESVGFDVMTIETPGILDTQIIQQAVTEQGFQLEASNEYLHFLLIEVGGDVGRAFQKFLSESQLSSHMLAIARKPNEENAEACGS